MANENLENNKRWLVCGFNGFDQFKVENKRKLHQFEEFHIPFNEGFEQPIVACSWSYLAIAYNCTLQLQGFVSSSSERVKTIRTKYSIKSLAVCEKYCLLLLENKKVYQLLHHSIDDRLRELTFQTEQEIDFATDPIKIAYIACGNNISVAVSTCNAVFSGLTQIHKFPKEQCVTVKQLQCGFEHAVLLTLNGDIYSWGNGLKAQLGQDNLTVEETPVLVNALAGIKITYIAAGGWHSAAISVFGDIYTWGFNSNGQLGIRIIQNDARTLMEQELYPLPQIVDLPTCQCSKNIAETVEMTQKCYPINVMAGGRHTILLMTCGAVYAAGWNFYGQLGLKTLEKSCDNFKYVLTLEGYSHLKDIKIICGNWCTIIYK